MENIHTKTKSSKTCRTETQSRGSKSKTAFSTRMKHGVEERPFNGLTNHGTAWRKGVRKQGLACGKNTQRQKAVRPVGQRQQQCYAGQYHTCLCSQAGKMLCCDGKKNGRRRKKQSHLIDTDDGSIVPVSQLPQLRAQGGQMLSSDDQVLVVIVTAEQSCHRVHHHQLDFATSQCHRQLFLQAYLQGILKSQQADGTTVLLCLVFYSLCKILLTAGTKPKESETRFI